MWRRLFSSPHLKTLSLSHSHPRSAVAGLRSLDLIRHVATQSAGSIKKRVEDVVPIATGHEREDLEKRWSNQVENNKCLKDHDKGSPIPIQFKKTVELEDKTVKEKTEEEIVEKKTEDGKDKNEEETAEQKKTEEGKEDFQARVETLDSKLDMITKQIDRFADMIDKQIDRIADMIDRIADMIDKQIDMIADMIDKQIDRIADMIDRIADMIDKQIDRIADRIDKLIDMIDKQLKMMNGKDKK